MALTTTKFSFDRVFGVEPINHEALRAEEQAELIATARDLGFAEGLAQGEAAVHASLTAQLSATVNDIAAQLATLHATLTQTQKALVADAAHCLGALTEVLAGEAVTRFPLERVEGIVAPLFAELIETPRLVVRVAPALLDVVKERLEDVAIASGYAGRIIFLAQDDLQPGDVRVEWAHGGLDARIADACTQLRQSFTDFILTIRIDATHSGSLQQ
jgi:flagellar assembly protein FliH